MSPSSPFEVPYARRRNTPAQLHALCSLFDATQHPTRAQRQALASQTGMELKSVTNWFQNRRQLSRRKSLSLNENDHTKLRPPRNRRPKTPLDRSKISLDRIAALSERPSLTWQPTPPRSPLTPRKSNVQQKAPPSPSDLWMHMVSSPAVPRSSPDPEATRLAVLSSRAETLCPLEWACFKARQKNWAEDDANGSSIRVGAELGALRPETVSPHIDTRSLDKHSAPFSRPNMAPQFEDVEAAITLLGFKGRL